MPAIRLKRSQLAVNTDTNPSDSVPAVAVAGPSEPQSAVSDAPINMQSLPGTASTRRTRPRSRTIATIFSPTSPTSDPRDGYMRRITSGQDIQQMPRSSKTYHQLFDTAPSTMFARSPGSPASRTSNRSYFLSTPEQQAVFSSPSSMPENPLDQAPASPLTPAPPEMSPLSAARSRSRGNSLSSFTSPVDFRLPPGEKGITDEVIRRTSLERASMDLPPSVRNELRASFEKGERPQIPEPSPVRELEEEMEQEEEEHHHDEVVEHLDVIDPGVSTVSHLANAANSILIPPIFASTRKPVVTLPEISLLPSDSQAQLLPDHDQAEKGLVIGIVPGQDGRPAEYDELDLHVEHVLRKRDKAKRALKGLWAFLKTPMGIVTAIYGFLVAFWGAAIVLFLLHWINVHNDYYQKLWIEITCQIENGLFTITGVGLIPWRAMDTYRIAQITHYKMLSHKLRKQRGMKALTDENDLPDPETCPEPAEAVLSEEQQKALNYQQEKFMKSQTWYRPHETDTHHAFPITTALWICLFIDGNSIFQCMLCGTMWGLNMYNRPAWTTGCLVPLSFLCGIIAAVLIWRGGQKTKKVQEVEDKFRDALGVPLEDEPVKRSTSLKRMITKASSKSRVSGKVEKEAAKEGAQETAQGILEPGPSTRT